MSIRSLNYLDIPPAKRRESAAKSLSRLRERVNDPLLDPEQAKKLVEQMAKLERWANITKEGA